MFCAKCGSELKDNSRFCPNCGSAVASSGPKEQVYHSPVPSSKPVADNPMATPAKKMTLFWIIWTLVSVFDLLLIIGGFSWLRLGLLAGIQIVAVLLRKKLFRKPLASVIAWLVIALAVLGVYALTGGESAGEEPFKQYKDYKQERKATLEVLDSFAKAAEAGDAKAAVPFIEEGRRPYYSSLLAKDPAKMKLVGSAMKNAEMVELAAPESEISGKRRYAEFEVPYDNLTFHIRMVKINGSWWIETF